MNILSITELCCEICGRYVYLDDQVDLDFLNGISHQSCGKEKELVKYSGTYQSVINRYPYFDSTLIKIEQS